MGSMLERSELRGERRRLYQPNEPILLHRVFEHTVREMQKMRNNTAATFEPIHSINLSNDVTQETALIYRGREKTFADLNEESNRLARAFLSFIPNTGYFNSDGDLIIAVALQPSDTLIVTLLACWKIGAAYLPIDPSFPMARIKHILTESQPALVVVNQSDKSIFQSEHVMDIETLKEEALALNSNELTREEEKAPKVPDAERLAMVLYTSGSTGVPKGVRVRHSSILNRLKWQWNRFPYSGTEKVGIFKTALTFVDSVSEIWSPLLCGRSVLIVPNEDRKDAERIMDILEEYKVERLVLVPTLLQSMLLYLKSSESGKRLSRLQLWVCSGEALSLDLVQQFYNYFDKNNHLLCNFYGSTEVMGDVTFYAIDDLKAITTAGKVPIGSPIHNCIVYLLDKDLKPVKSGEIGEIYASGLNLAAGYVLNRDANRFIFNDVAIESGHEKLYRTGDFGSLRGNLIFYEGRTDSQIKIRGHRVDLSEVQLALSKIESVKESVVLAYNPGEPNQELLAFVIPIGKVEVREIVSKLHEMIPSYEVPTVIIVESIPLLVNGKVDRQTLLNMYREKSKEFSGDVNFEGIDDSLMDRARAVFQAAAESLGSRLRGRIKANSSYADLGGNSLNSVYFVTKLIDYGYRISIREFLKSSTLLDVIKKLKADDGGVVVDVGEAKDETNKYTIEIVTEKTRKEFTKIICFSFSEKADLESYLEGDVPLSDYEEAIDKIWDEILEAQLSFVVMNEKGEIVGAAVNKDAHKESEAVLRPENRLNIVFQFLDYIEQPILKKHLPKEDGKLLHNFMLASKRSLSIEETIELFIFMEEALMKLAKSLNFRGVFTSNTSPLTQQLGKSVNAYQTLMDYQPNQYIAEDGSRPFATAPDSLRTIVCWKPV